MQWQPRPQRIFLSLEEREEFFKISLGARLMQSWKQCALLATTMAIWQIMASAHDFLLQHCSSYAQVQELQRSHWCDNREDTLFSWLPVLLLWDLSNVCRRSLTTTCVIYTHIDRCGSKQLDTGVKHCTSFFPVLL